MCHSSEYTSGFEYASVSQGSEYAKKKKKKNPEYVWVWLNILVYVSISLNLAEWEWLLFYIYLFLQLFYNPFTTWTGGYLFECLQ